MWELSPSGSQHPHIQIQTFIKLLQRENFSHSHLILHSIMCVRYNPSHFFTTFILFECLEGLLGSAKVQVGLGVFRLGRLIRNFKMIWEGVGVPRMIMRIWEDTAGF